MADEHEALIQQVLDLQGRLCRLLRPTREWLEVDLTMPQLKVLFLLYAEGGASMSQLASSLGVSLSTVSGIVDRLVEHGMVQREEPPEDRRLVLCHLTSQGSALVERLHQAGRARLAELLAHLSVGELRTILAGLEVLCTAAQREGVDTARRPGVLPVRHLPNGHARVNTRSR
ncbi:MAG TPA: MarR family transcriptional regulator [Chloroflexota bacterium]|nr:MarR family transcriptional regulator [Chloroflexota bacterium]